MPFPAALPLEGLTEADLADLDVDTLLYVVLDPTATALSRGLALATLSAYIGADFIPTTEKAAALGVATLDAGGLLLTSQLPPLALGETFTVASQAAMLALVAQRGDLAIRTDLDPDGFFLLTSDSPGTLADWKQILAPGSVVSVDGQTGAVSLGATYIAQALLDANTVVIATADNTPIALAMGASTILARLASGNIVAATPAQLAALLAGEVFKQAQEVNAQTGTTYTLVAGDAGKLVTLSNASPVTLTLPQDSDATIAVGTYVDLYALGAGQVTVAAGTGATLRTSGLTAKSRAQYARFGVQKVSANTWSLFGDLAAS